MSDHSDKTIFSSQMPEKKSKLTWVFACLALAAAIGLGVWLFT